MCNRARMRGEPETLWGSMAQLFSERPRDNRFDPVELRPKSRSYVVREQDGERAWDVMTWDVLGGKAKWPMTNVRQLALPQWRRLAEKPENRCIVPLTEFCEFTPDKHDLGDGRPPLKGEMWFSTDQRVFPVAGFWQRTKDGTGFTMVTCDPNELVAPIHPKAMITILEPEDVDTWLRGSYDEVVALQKPYDAAKMTVRGPVFPTRTGEE
ncbi:SOS response-associated peptidase family protein [Novosphingobium sp. RD2P27]|uniref:Abasic site processing protein n=1 Tax=Novosphingobium kalidii TaxID=3230299 RepID=A0ABV2D3T3_9SPHN